MDGVEVALPDPARFTGHGDDWIRYQAADPKVANPLVVEYLVSRNLPVIRLAEVPRSLEKAYLQAMSETGNTEPAVGLAEPALPVGDANHVG
jgi:hypothetical protein